MNPPKKLEDCSVLEINAEIGLRMELVERAVFELNALRQRREIQSKLEQLQEIKFEQPVKVEEPK